MIKQLLLFANILATAYMAWKLLGAVTNTESPIVVVLSESMSPAFERGDILFLSMSAAPIVTGDIVVFKIAGREIPIVHRALKIHQNAKDGKLFVLTKGDNNGVHDRGLYNRGQLWLHRQDIVGRVRGYVPYIGMFTILINDYPKLKVAFLGLLGAYVLLARE